MKYVELLSRIKPATSPFVGDMQNSDSVRLTETQQRQSDAAKKSRCITCRGRKRVKVAPKQWDVCPRCFGSGRYVEGNQRQTRASAKPDSTPHDMIANLTQDMNPNWYRAAAFFATHDQKIGDMLVEDIRTEIVMVRADSWQCSNDVRKIRALGLSRVAMYNLVLPRTDPIDVRQACLIMCCKERNWRKTWEERSHGVTRSVRGWIANADEHMRERAELARSEVG